MDCQLERNVLIAAVLGFVVCGSACSTQPIEIDAQAYTPLELQTVPETKAIVIPVYFEEGADKKPTMRLFELYGFSGNGPSIEQVVRKNAELAGLDFSSEGGAFYATAQDDDSFENAIKQLECVEDIACLNNWLHNAKSIVIKE